MKFITVFAPVWANRHYRTARCSSLRHINEGQRPLHARCGFHRAHTHLIPSSLLFNPQTGLLEGSVTTPWLALSYQVNLSCSHRGSPQLDVNELRHDEINENFLFKLSLSICLGGNVASSHILQCNPELGSEINILKWIFEDWLKIKNRGTFKIGRSTHLRIANTERKSTKLVQVHC